MPTMLAIHTVWQASMNELPSQVDDLEKISLDKLMGLRAPGTYLVRVEGDSMDGAGIFSGDLLVVDRMLDAKHGSIVIAAMNCEPVCKRMSLENGQIVLRSENSKYPPRYILEGDSFEIWGVVTHSVRDHDRSQ